MAVELNVSYRPSMPYAIMGREFTDRQNLPQRETTIFVEPTTISRENFMQLDGLMQETILISLLSNRNINKVGELRPDFGDMDKEPLTMDEKRMAEWTQQIIQRQSPIKTPRIDIDDGLYAQIHHTVFDMPEDNLTAILERERQRRVAFTPGMFSPAEDIGKFTAARRYRGILENYVERQQSAQSKAA